MPRRAVATRKATDLSETTLLEQKTKVILVPKRDYESAKADSRRLALLGVRQVVFTDYALMRCFLESFGQHPKLPLTPSDTR